MLSDPETYEKYKAATGEVFKRFGANFIVRGGRYKGLQGAIRSRHVVIEFEATTRRSNATTRPSTRRPPSTARAPRRARSSSAKDRDPSQPGVGRL